MKRKFSKLLMTAIMLLIASEMFICTKTTVQATSKNANEAISWVQSKLGQKVGSGQCVALIQAYYSFLGVNPTYGNGQDYATNPLPDGWTRVQGGTPQKGDILVYRGVTGVDGASEVAMLPSMNPITPIIIRISAVSMLKGSHTNTMD